MPPTKRAKKKYSAVAPAYKTQGQFNKAVQNRSQAQINPLLEDVANRRSQTQQETQTRQNELGGWYGHQQNALKSAQDRLDSSLRNLLATNESFGAGASGALNAALRQSSQANQTEAQRLGVEMPGAQPDYLSALGAYGTAGQMGLTGDMAGALTRSAADIGIGGIAGREAGTAEQNRARAIFESLGQEESDIRGRLPSIMEAMRSTLTAEELTKRQQRKTEQGQAFQQDLARDQFGLERKQSKFQRKLARRQQSEAERSNVAGETLSAQELADRRAEVKAATGADKRAKRQERRQKKAQTRAKRYNTAREFLNSLVNAPMLEVSGDPNTNDTNETKVKRQIPDPDWRRPKLHEVWDQLIRTTGVSEKEAMDLIEELPFEDWRRQIRRWRDARRLNGPT